MGNVREIESLNQRGGRMLSVVDLIEDGTLDVPTAAVLLSLTAAGASFLTAAGPGGVGKSTLLAVLLSFLPPDERIVTVTDPAHAGDSGEATCWLCHEIGAGHWYGYLWGRRAADFFALNNSGRIAATLHADTAEEAVDQLLGPGVGASETDIAAIDVLLTMVRTGGKRRVSTVYISSGAEIPRFEPMVTWDPHGDRFEVLSAKQVARVQQCAERSSITIERATEFIKSLIADQTRYLEDVVQAVADLYCASRGSAPADLRK